jgi:HTH-type transcriptional regulator/antitoxin HipB
VDYPVRTPEQLGSVIKGFRAVREITQAELGRRTGLAQNAISEFERDPGKSSIRKLYRLLSALGLEIALREVAPPVRTKRAKSAPAW